MFGLGGWSRHVQAQHGKPKNRQCYIVISPHPAGRKLFPSCFPAKKWNLNLNHGAMRIHCMGIASKKLVRTICPATPPALAIGVQSTAFWLLCSSYLGTSAHQSTSTSSTWDFRGPRANCKHPNQRDVTKGKVMTVMTNHKSAPRIVALPQEV